MSLFKISGKNGTPLSNLVNEFKTIMAEQGTSLVSSDTTAGIIAMESLSPIQADELSQNANSIADSLRSAFDSILESKNGLGFESLTDSQIQAGVVAAMAAGNPVEYAMAALNNRAKNTGDIKVIAATASGSAGRLDFRDEVAMEAFDQRVLEEMMPYSIAFNVQAARQDEFSETFFPTVVISPENGGMDVTIEHTSVYNAIKHSSSGKATTFDQSNLLEAVSNADILADESTALVPFVQPDNSNLDMFIDPALVGTSVRKVSGEDIETAPLVVGKEINLIGISDHPGLIGAGILDHTDAVDPRLFVETLIFANEYDDAGTPANDVLRFNVSRLPRNAFINSIEGSGREMTLNFRADALTINAATTNVDGSALGSTTLIASNDYTVRIGINVTGSAHLEYGTVEVVGATVNVLDIFDVDGNEISKSAGAGLAVVTAMKSMRLVGYELGASRTNSNRRTRGLLLNNNSQTERFAIPLGAPISAPAPIGSGRDTRDLESLISAARIRNSNNAVTTLLNYAETLRSYVINAQGGYGKVSIEGIARHVVSPFFEEIDLDMTTALNSIRSKDRADDISSALINTIRDLAYRMYRDSRYQAALDASSLGGKRPTLLVGTDSVIQRHLMVEGDTRTFGMTFENSKIVHSFDSRMANKVIISFTRDGGEGSVDPLGFGNHGWIPELTSSMTVTRDGATYQEAMVQPRSRHVNNLPIMAVINVTNLEEVMTSKIAP